jgi:hypothetical protein
MLFIIPNWPSLLLINGKWWPLERLRVQIIFLPVPKLRMKKRNVLCTIIKKKYSILLAITKTWWSLWFLLSMALIFSSQVDKQETKTCLSGSYFFRENCLDRICLTFKSKCDIFFISSPSPKTFIFTRIGILWKGNLLYSPSIHSSLLLPEKAFSCYHFLRQHGNISQSIN